MHLGVKMQCSMHRSGQLGGSLYEAEELITLAEIRWQIVHCLWAKNLQVYPCYDRGPFQGEGYGHFYCYFCRRLDRCGTIAIAFYWEVLYQVSFDI